MRLRTKAREIALCLLYEFEMTKKEASFLLDDYFHTYPHKAAIKDFTQRLVREAIEHCSTLDDIIKKYVKNWDIERIAIVDKNILRLASLELLFFDDIPPKVSINEAVELAKKFGDIDSPRFINGILDKIYKWESKKASPEFKNG